MIFPTNFESKIGFDTVRSSVIGHCMGVEGRRLAENMSFSPDYEEVRRRLDETGEMLFILTSGMDFPLAQPDDVMSLLPELRAEGGYLSGTRLLSILKLLRQCDSLKAFFSRSEEDSEAGTSFPALRAVSDRIRQLPALGDIITASINKFGEVKDTASDRLYEVRKNLRAANGSMSNAMRRVLDRAVSEGIIDRDVTPAIRDGRMVIPVEASLKRSIKGIVHDASASGRTVYIEPFEVVEAANRIRELEIEEQHEVVEELKRIAGELRPYSEEIAESTRIVGKFDFINAKARFAMDVDGRLPHLERKRCLEWYHAVHPSLLMSLRAQGREVVPLNLTLSEEERILVISGPNAGGKSVCLKTAGVVQYMTQCGLLPTVYENSHVGVFDNIYLDIGDEQSIENDLSTYSSHLRNMKYFLQHTSCSTFVLADEMGSGTEPQIGGALAQAILTKLGQTKCFGIVTTHYQNLKTFAAETEGFVNGAMLYDRQHLQPTFQLSVGSPGSSFAIEIARKTGLGNDVIELAKEIVGSDYVNLDKYLLDIARDRRYWSNKRQAIKEKESKLDSLLARYEDKSDDLKSQRNAILHDAKKEAKEILAGLNARIEKTISEIRKVNAEKEATKNLRRDLESYAKAVMEQEETESPLPEVLRGLKHKSRERRIRKEISATKTPGSKINEGDYVKMKDSNVVGKVLRVEGKVAEVAFGALRTKSDINRLLKAEAPKSGEDGGFSISRQTSEDSRKRQLEFRQDIDVRGMRGDEAVQAVVYFLDDAVQFGAKRLRILHGTGHGILKTLIRQQLDAYPAVVNYTDEDVRFGGAGITVVDLA